ncbi:MAG: hypothetical protein NTW62_01865 [Candidatus Nomurabacteria bacterium]|nr:hypothetical protein [Candidatus Nomurabacteria bacterium]
MKKKLISSASLVALSALVPFIASAAQNCLVPTGGTDIPYMICRVSNIINSLVPLFIALGVVYFIWGVISYAISKEEEAKKEGKARIIYGLIALLVIVSIWGLVSILQSSFGISSAGNTDTVFVPCINSDGTVC